MNVKTLTGPSIHAALAEARQLLGDDVVLLEAVPPSGGAPARVTVLADAAANGKPGTPPVKAATEDAKLVPFGYGGQARRPAAGPATGKQPGKPGSLFPAPASPASAARSATKPAAAPEEMQKLFDAQMKAMMQRMDRLERLLQGSLVGATHEWVAHPLFSELLRQGIRPATARTWFDALASSGMHPAAKQEDVKWALAQEIRKSLTTATPKKATGTLLLMGPSGAGKTSLTLKLARHQAFYGRRKTAILVVQPENADDTGYLSPIELYKRNNLPVLAVSSPEEMRAALDRVQRFDQVLIDTPSMPGEEVLARKMLTTLKRIVDPVVPLHVVLVVNATRALEDFDVRFLKQLPLRPDSAALTHLDEISGWGRIAEWMLRLRAPVQFASTSPRVPDGLVAFSPAWFVEEMLQL